MNYFNPKHRWGKFGLFLLSSLSVLSVSATYFLSGGPVFLPLVMHQEPSPTLTATITPTPKNTPTPTQTQAGTPGPNITPLPEGTLLLVVTPPDKDWALAFFAKSYNGAGRPIMAVYPSDTSPQSERIKIPRGTIVLALKDPVIADGGGKYWQLVDYKGRDGEVLFLKATDVTKVTA